ncbi:hypothetical protein SHKM778_53670 [Streptomyces sp. KM77-8]|uniref:Uncharacterized protein n=1 Tax=Streptomyces haneummycinicus TaxID=3074435 RepID=A0AAT9HNE3_9ACTN
MLEANAVLMDAFDSDVRPLLREVREEMGLDPEPLKAYKASGWAERIVAERVGGEQAGWGRERLPGFCLAADCRPSGAGRARAAAAAHSTQPRAPG